MGKTYSITYDFGTGSVKGAVIDSDHDVVAWDLLPYKLHYPEPDFVIQKNEDYWDCFCQLTKRLIEKAGIRKEQVKGVVISQTTSTMIFVDENGTPLNDCLTWLDNRAVGEAGILNRRAGKEWTQGKRVPAKVLWFLNNRPDIINKAAKLLDVSAYLYLRLTGHTAFDLTAADAYDLTKANSREWDPEKIACVGMDRSLLPDRIILSYEEIGRMLPGVAEEAGFAPGTPIFGGCSDNANGHIGAGCIRPGDAHLYMGSSGWISLTVELPQTEGNIMRSAVPGIGYDYYCTDSVGTSIDYLINEFYREEKKSLGEEVYKFIAKEVESVEHNHEDTLFLAFLYGEEEPVLDPAVRASLLNVKATTSRAHIARAVMEGTAFNYLWIKKNLQERGVWKPNFVRAIGGGAQNDAHLQIIADVIDEKVVRLKNCRVAGNIGLSACVDIGLNEADDFNVLDNYVKDDKTFTPRPEFRERHDRLFDAYKRAYYGLKDVYETLNL